MKSREDNKRQTKDVHRPPGKRRQPETPSPKRLAPAEAAYFQEQEKYRLLAESAPLGIAVIGSTGRYHYLNPRFVEMFGYTLEDIPNGQEWFAKAYPDSWYRNQVISDWKLYLQESRVGESEPRIFTVTCKDGAAKVIKFRAVPLEGGEQFVLYEDITELQQAEEALKESEERLRLVQECAGDAFFVHDAGRILEVNQQACDSLGYSREELIGMSLFDIEVGISPEELTKSWQQSPSPLRTLQGRHRRKDGSTFPVEVKASFFDYRGKRLRLGLARDVTDRVEAEAALRESELKYRSLVEQIPAITFISPWGSFETPTYVSPQVESVLGFSPADFEADPNLWVNQLHPEDRDWVLAEVDKCQKTGDPFDCEYRIKARDGRTVWFQDMAQVVQDSSGRSLFLQGVSLDITRRKELEAALQESEAHYRTLFETSPDAILVFDMDQKLTMANTAAAALYGVERAEEMVGMSAFEFVAPESLALAQKLDQERSAQENFIEAEFSLLKKDGSSFLAETRTSVLRNPDGSPRAFLAVAKDITARKRAEEKLVEAKEEWERTFNAIPARIMIVDTQYRIVKVNRAMAHRFGYSPEEMEGKLCYQEVHGLEAPPLFCPHSELLSTGQTPQVEIWDDRDQSYFLVSSTPICDPSGKVIGSVQVATDLTERKMAEEALRESEENYRLLVGQIPAVVFKGYEDWSIECFDDKIETLTGYSKEEFSSRRLTWRDLIPAEDLPYVKEVFQKALKGDGSYFREHRIRKKNGEFAWVQCRGQIFLDETGAVNHISGVTFDITARKKAEAALRESEERYRLIAENVSDVIWTANLDLETTYISPSIQQLLGFNPEEIIGRPLGEVLPPASLGRALEILCEELDREQKPQEPKDLNRSRVLELRQLHKNGSKVWTEIKARFLRDSQDRPVGILGVDRDITERKQAEKALRRREAVLEAVSYTAEKCLKTHSWEEDLQEILERLGHAVQVSRIYIFENQTDKKGTLLVSLRHEWVDPNIAPQIDNPEFLGTSYKAAGFERWEELLPQGQIIWGPVAQFPPSEQALLVARGTKSIVVVPIFVGQQWWGGVGFEDCFQEREWSSMEIDALLTAASILGLTILHHKEERALRESEEKLRSLSYQLLTAQEQERKRLASELHNVLGHDLLLLKLKLESLQEELGAERQAQAQKVLQVVRALQDSVRNVRRLCQDLTPGDLEDLGLTTALHLLVENFAAAQKLTWEAELDDLDDLFGIPVQTALYRMVQEALTNIGKHAKAKHLWLRAQRAGSEAAFVIEDDGQGFNVAKELTSKKTLGLLAMEERVKILGGTFDIVSREQAGTKLTFTIPIFQRKGPQ